ncbi:hypothetical protein EU805_10395 [Salipiger sp. IMCC34102]|uniref:endonuclease/exonuclease/phosphatase family protein n=1 Tax=Salipiger sp. IMCC34102 TaxID=2510647 RepID=UPI00101CB3EA|nr:endonuclease/exonuclease/phosphatase family protein [Salipiger sp. IMCC34102]RYH02252.1 hypothetical protein EU805_10395 [Salipiger sp. IMCC34102]
MTIYDIGLWVVTGLTAFATVLPQSRLSHGFVRSADFPRQQLLALAIALICGALWLRPEGWGWMVGVLAACVVLHAFYIGRYLPIWHSQSVRPGADEAVEPAHTVSIIAANVKKSNRDFGKLVEVARAVDADIVTALETDQAWLDGLKPLHEIYPHVMTRPHDNGYGMAVYSRYPLEAAAFRDVVVEKVPSLRARVTLPGGRQFRLYVVHPEPPVPYLSTEGRDAELGAIGIEAHDDPLPAIVTGDLNDVAWSVTTKRFQNVSGLLDPRVGRGFYNTFSARMPLMRWPLDHLFHDPVFRLVEMKRLADIGSDHFPMYFKLLLTPHDASDSLPDEPCAEELEEVEEMIDRERNSGREAIGSHWEDDA